jgi:hypothetical protein
MDADRLSGGSGMYVPRAIVFATALLLQEACFGGTVAAGANGVRVENASLTRTDKTLEISYRIKNDSGEDIWLCEANGFVGDFEVYLSQDKRTLVVRRRFDIDVRGAISWLQPPTGRYVRLRSGESRDELMILPLPVWSWTVFVMDSASGKDALNLDQIAVEIGFYSKDVLVKDLLRKGIRTDAGVSHIEFTYMTVERPAQVLTLAFHNQVIPYVSQPTTRHYAEAPILRECRQIDIDFQPSMLEYFYPDDTQQALLYSSEKKFLRSQRSTTVKDVSAIMDLHEDVQQGWGAFVVCSGPTAQMVCHDSNQGMRTYTLYADRVLAIRDKGTRQYEQGVPALRKFTPQIQWVEPRMRCADHLHRLMSQIRWRGIQVKNSQPSGSGEDLWIYPLPERWCDAIVEAWPWMKQDLLVLFQCPGKNDGKSIYAINPSCEPNSPADMVMLFETKAGWNQHGGPELFTFDNHDPKGGCVLLNDGTLKFVRTKEELAQLRWKP